MTPIFSFEYPLRACDFDCYHYLQAASVMDLFQDAAGRHAIELGIGFPQLAEKHQMWILSGVQYQVFENPHMYQTVRVVTWPLPASSVTCRREYRMESLDGTLLVKGTSDWAIMDGDKRKLLRAREVYPEGLDYCTDLCFEERMPRLKPFETDSEGTIIVPGFAQLDMNGHVNNTKYANFILDCVNPKADENISVFQIHYRKELLPQQEVALYTKREENTIMVQGCNRQNEVMFLGRILLQTK
ncbi:MAG: hypothetical protein IKU10_05765 [Clostridia bacterium]|nr:hypothetical protein [Clostridia bacterium]